MHVFLTTHLKRRLSLQKESFSKLLFIPLLTLLLGISIPTTSIHAQAGTTWTSRTASVTGEWNCVAYGNGIFVALGTNTSTMMTSPDGITWTTRTAAAGNFWRSVTYGNGMFVAVSANGTISNQIMTSTDGINWTSRTAPTANMGWNSVTYGNGLFVAVAGILGTGTGAKVMTSTDGITWTSRTASANSDWTSVIYGNGQFVAVASGSTTSTVMTSPDGITWTGRTASVVCNWSSVAYGNNMYVAVANGSKPGVGISRLMSSPDGITWTTRGTNNAQIWNSIIYANNLFVAVAASGTNRVFTSPDGITWTGRTPAAANSWQSVAYGNGVFVAVSDDGTSRVMTSGCAATTPSVSIAASTLTPCSGASVTFTATPTNGGTTPTYQWKKNSNTITNATSATYTGTAGTDFANNDLISCVLTSSDACASPTTATSADITMSVSSNVTPSVNIVANPSGAITPNTSVTFTAIPTNGGTTPVYQWKKNNSNIGTNSDTYTDATLVNGDIISCEMMSNATCVSPTTITSNEIEMIVTSGCSTPTAYTVTGTGAYCAGGSGVEVGLSNSTIGVNYQLMNGANTVGSPINGTGTNISFGNQTTATTYTVVATTATGGCTATMTGNAIITINSAIANAGADAIVTCSNPSTTLSASGGSNYAWNNGATQDGTVFPNVTTTYIVTVTDANGCTATDDVVVTVDKTVPSANAGADVVVNCSSPSTVLTASGGTSYSWNNGASQGGTVSPNVTTTYTVIVTGANGCTATDDVVVTVDKAAPSANAGADVVVNCSNPSTVLTASGGVSYTWNNSASQGGTVSPNTTTTYTVIVTAANGCTATDVVVVTVDKTAPSANAGADVVVNCSSPNTVLTASGGSSYTWNNGATQGGTVSPNTTTTYTVIVTAANGCTATDDVVVTVDKTAPSANAGADVAITCANLSTVLTASGGVSYVWDNGITQGETVSPNVTTTYTVTVTSANGCTATDDVVVTVDKTAPSANAGSDVIITCSNPSTVLTASGGTSYTWNNGASQGGTVFPNVTTTYTVIVTGANGCTATDDVVVTVDKTAPSANAGADVEVTCKSPSTVLTASGGENYAWNNGATQDGTVSPNVTTTYTVTVTGANGCTATDDVIITSNKTFPIANAGADVEINCSNPSTVLTASGGSSNTWNNGATQGGTVSPNTTTTYTVIVTAANGCTATDDVVVTVDKTTPTANAGAGVAITCSNPSTVLTASGGVSYVWITVLHKAKPFHQMLPQPIV